MPAPVLSSDGQPSRWGYIAAILASAVGHVAILALVFVILPRLFKPAAPPPAYTVKIVDSIPAGDLGTHLPRLSHERHRQPPQQKRQAEEKPKPAPPPPDNDKNAIALNSIHSITPTPTPTPEPTPEPTEAPTPAPTAKPTPRPKPKPRPTRRPTPAPTPAPKRVRHREAKPTPVPEIAKASPRPRRTPMTAPTPNTRQELARVREQLLAEHLKQIKEREKNGRRANSGGGPVLADRETSGKGYGVGSGTGSAGIQQDAQFLLYYQDVQKKIKDAWSFAGSNPNLTATVVFGINPDGSLNSVRVVASSHDPSFDDSVIRAIRRAAPFAPPPDKYRPEFARGIETDFKLGELSS